MKQSGGMPSTRLTKLALELMFEMELLTQQQLSPEFWSTLLTTTQHPNLLKRALDHEYRTGGLTRLSEVLDDNAAHSSRLIQPLAALLEAVIREGAWPELRTFPNPLLKMLQSVAERTPPTPEEPRSGGLQLLLRLEPTLLLLDADPAADVALALMSGTSGQLTAAEAPRLVRALAHLGRHDLRKRRISTSAASTLFRAALTGVSGAPGRRLPDGRLPMTEPQGELVRELVWLAKRLRFGTTALPWRSVTEHLGAQPTLLELIPELKGAQMPFREALAWAGCTGGHQFWELYTAYQGYLRPEERDELLFSTEEYFRRRGQSPDWRLFSSRLSTHQEGHDTAAMYASRSMEALTEAVSRTPHRDLANELLKLPITLLRILTSVPGENLQTNLDRLAVESEKLRDVLEQERRKARVRQNLTADTRRGKNQ